jgi:hypothetical protein
MNVKIHEAIKRNNFKSGIAVLYIMLYKNEVKCFCIQYTLYK